MNLFSSDRKEANHSAPDRRVFVMAAVCYLGGEKGTAFLRRKLCRPMTRRRGGRADRRGWGRGNLRRRGGSGDAEGREKVGEKEERGKKGVMGEEGGRGDVKGRQKVEDGGGGGGEVVM